MLNILLDAAAKLNEMTDIRFFVFGMESTVFAFYCYYASDFIRKARKKQEYELKNDLAYTWAAFFILQALMSAIIVYADYFQSYIPSSELFVVRDYILNLAGVMGVLGIILIARKSEQILDTKYIITILLSIICACVLFFFHFPKEYFMIFQMLAYVVNIWVFNAAVKYVIGDHPILRKQLKIFTWGFIFMAFSQFARSDLALNIAFRFDEKWVYNTRFFADVGLLVTCFILQMAFTQFPSLFELEWRKHLKEIHVVHMKGGNEIFAYFFDDSNKENSEIVGGFMYGVNQLVAEITGSDTALHMIKQKENVVCFEKNEQMIVVLIAKEYNEIYNLKLKQLLNNLMIDYGHLLENWNGNKTPFKNMEDVIEKIFK